MTAESSLALKQLLVLSLGLFGVAAIVLSLVPSLQRLNVRRTKLKVLAGMPMSPEQIGAERDQLRAQFAAEQRRSEQKIEAKSTKLTEEMAELGRRATRIAQLETETAQLMMENAELRAQNGSRNLAGAQSAQVEDLQNEVEALRRLLRISEDNLAHLREECDLLRDSLLRAGRAHAGSSAYGEDVASLRKAIVDFGEKFASGKRAPENEQPA